MMSKSGLTRLNKKRLWAFYGLLSTALLIKVFSGSPLLVEQYYSNGIYPVTAAIQRVLFGWIPFSVGDLFYTAAGIWLIIKLTSIVRTIPSRGRTNILPKVISFLNGLLVVYVTFNLLWGLNYNRVPMGEQLGLNMLDYTNSDLVEVTHQLASKLDELHAASRQERLLITKKKHLFQEAANTYELLARNDSRFTYSRPSVKPSMFSYPGNYLGFTGYYNPFSGEAQVNTTVPAFIRPFTTCHEIGHQLGYAKESEANFAGYLAATRSENKAFLYSVYFDMFAYASRYLYFADSVALKSIQSGLSGGVKADIREVSEFFSRYSTPLEKLIDNLYARYLRANEQPSGKMSYNEVVALLIAYYKKHGEI